MKLIIFLIFSLNFSINIIAKPSERNFSPTGIDDIGKNTISTEDEEGEYVNPISQQSRPSGSDLEQNSISAELEKIDDFRYQGDLMLTDDQKIMFDLPLKEGQLKPRVGLLDQNYRWPKMSDGKVKVPFVIMRGYCKR